jgi:hypothetical protein
VGLNCFRHGVMESAMGLIGGLSSQHQLIWLCKEAGYSSLKDGSIFKERNSGSIVFVETFSGLDGHAEQRTNDLGCLEGFGLNARDSCAG